jgi:hypothetical protein
MIFCVVFTHSHFIKNPLIWSWETNPLFMRWFYHIKHYGITAMEKRRNKFDGSEPIRWWEESPLRTLQVGRRREEIVRMSSSSSLTGGEKNKQWCKNVFGVTSYITEPDISHMSHRWIKHIRWFETLTIHQNRVTHNIHHHLCFIILKFHRYISHVLNY